MEFGHTLYADSPWAITSISQRQFWNPTNLADFGDGRVGGILSVDISDWETPGIVYRKPAMQCSAEEIKSDVREQIKVHVNVAGADMIRDDDVLTWFLDPDIQFPNPTGATNREPLMVNTAGSLQYRPEASAEVPNLFLASEWVYAALLRRRVGVCQASCAHLGRLDRCATELRVETITRSPTSRAVVPQRSLAVP